MLAALWRARDVLLLGFLAVLVAVVFSFPVDWLSRIIPRGLAVLVVLVVLLGGLTIAVVFAAPAAVQQAQALGPRAAQAFERAREWFEHARRSASLAPLAPGPQSGQEVQSVLGKLVPAAVTTVSALTAVLLMVVLAAFLVHQSDSYREALRTLVPREKEAVYDELARRLGQGLRHWVAGILVSMLVMGGLTALGLGLAGIEGWPVLAALTFLATFVPYVGAIASAIPGLLVGLAQSPRHFLLAGAVYLGIHVVEGYLVQPVVMKRAVEVRPAMLLLGQAVLAALFGLMGAVVATPLIVCAKIAVGYLYIERRLGKQGPRP